ncbi:glycosyltransferase family 2 protein [Grimontia kaedaensis]|uniref:glycosyltransferase family 2 protein n=1 Tax=Grimontia kaedaensis TaxID=2872157 RepID=UPI0020741818|nr:glycosyltransferase family 2 protein [Grimontia kaedaensis]
MAQDFTPDLSVVCPCYNEEETITPFLESILPVLEQTACSFEVIFINDGSSDKTLEKIRSEVAYDKTLRVINLSRNFGKEAALTAGLDFAKGKAVIPIDVDLQDPPELILQLVSKWKEGFDVVLAKRVDRSSDTLAKSLTASLFYKFHNSISGIEVPENVGDFRLISRKVVEAIKLLPENQRFMKGIFSWVGFNSTVVEYTRQPRAAGETHFNGWKLWNFAMDGITSFSTVPLRVWLYLGVLCSGIAFFYGSFIIVKTIIFGVDLPGYASLVTMVLFFGGVQLIGLGVMGEYIGRLYIESKRRPVYIIENNDEI